MLTKDLLRVSRAGGGYHPQFLGSDSEDHRRLAARVLGTYQGHVGEPQKRLTEAITDIERDSEFDFKLVRGLAKLLDREATFETRAPIDPERARRTVFDAAESVGVVTESERENALERAADHLSVAPDRLDETLYNDLEPRQRMTEFDARWSPEELLTQYDLSLAQTALFDATAVTIRSSEPKPLVSMVKRLGLLYEIRTTPDGRVVHVTGPDAMFRRTRRYGTRFGRLLRTVARAPEWELEATIDDDGTERSLQLTHEVISVPGTEPVTEMTFDSAVEADFATRFERLDIDWALVREPEPLAAGEHVMIPDFAFDWQPDHVEFRVFFEIMGFWTPDYIEKKLSRLADLEAVEMVVAVDESLGLAELPSAANRNAKRDVGEQIESLDHRVVPYTGSVRVKDVRDVLRRYEEDLIGQSASTLSDQLVPLADVVTIEALATEHGVSEAAIENKAFPEHERAGRTLIRPALLEQLEKQIESGQSLSTVESMLEEHGIAEASAVLSHLDYRVVWNGLSGGTIQKK